MSNIFISYSHQDKEWVHNWLLPRLEKAGHQVVIDTRDFKIGISSLINMEKAVDECDKVLLVLTADWLKSEWTNFESLMIQSKDPTGSKGCILPLKLKECELPKRLAFLTYTDFRVKDNWDRELSRLLAQLAEPPASQTIGEKEEVGKQHPNISLAKMPATGPVVFGREKELAILDNAWQDDHCHIVILQAWGGVGKTALVNYWLNFMEKENYQGAARVYAWSFYSQGAEEGKQASADEFFQETLQFFGEPHPEKGSNVEHAARAPSEGVGNSYRSGVSDIQPEQLSNVEKGRHLAALLRREKCLIILDGLEPLQHPTGGL